MTNKGKIGAVATGTAIILGLTGAVMCTERIPAGYVGIVYNMVVAMEIVESKPYKRKK